MIIEINKNEALWLLDKITNECIRGQIAIAGVGEPTSDEMVKAVKDAKSIIRKLTDRGMRITDALEKDSKAERGC